jgi:nucleotide-binding universal stress UspA family protein
VNGFPEKVMLATDGLESTTLASRAAADLAKGGGAEFHVVHVWHSVPSVDFDRLIRSGLRDAGREALEEQVRWIEEEGGTVAGAYLREGQAVEAIIEQAEEIGAGLIVVGSRGMGRLGRLVMGSVSMGLAHRSPCPVLIVREGEEGWPPDRVLVGYGSFEDTGRAGFLGASLGRALGARIELIGVVSEANAVAAEAGLRDMERALAARADEIEDAVGERPRVRPIVGDVPRVILDVLAEEEKPALLSFGSKVLGRAGRVMVGEVLDWVLGETGGPILVTPEPHSASKAGILERAEIGAQEAPAVLVATDGSKVSLRAGDAGEEILGAAGEPDHLVREHRSVDHELVVVENHPVEHHRNLVRQQSIGQSGCFGSWYGTDRHQRIGEIPAVVEYRDVRVAFGSFGRRRADQPVDRLLGHVLMGAQRDEVVQPRDPPPDLLVQ